MFGFLWLSNLLPILCFCVGHNMSAYSEVDQVCSSVPPLFTVLSGGSYIFPCACYRCVCLCLFEGSQICFSARLSVSAWRVPTCLLCSLLYHVCLEDPNLFYLCLPGGSQPVFVLANAPRLSGGSQICFCEC